MAAGAAQAGHVPGVDDLELGLVDEEHLRLGHAGGLVHHRALGVFAGEDGAAHEGPLDLVATALEGGLAPDLEVAVGLLDGLAGNGAGAAATAHDDARVIEVDLLGEVLVHTACGHGVDLGADHHVPADGGVDGGDGLENLDGLHGAGVLAAELEREGEAEDALVDEDVDRFVGQTAQLLGLVAAFADYLGELVHTLKRGAFERG